MTDGPADAADFLANWSQELRLPLYTEALDQLRDHPRLFACPCSRKELASGAHRYDCLKGQISLDDVNVAWRWNTRDLDPVRIPDLARPHPFSVDLHLTMPDFVVRKKDGRPSYQPACVVDDVHFGIDGIGRGEDLLPSTAAQAVLSEAIGYGALFDRISFLHHPLVTNAEGNKLSKSAGAAGISALRKEMAPAEVFAVAERWLVKG